MKFSIAKDELVSALSVVSKGMSSRSTLPILSGILVSATKENLIFQSTDLEVSIRHTTSALIEEEGQIVIPGKLLGDIVKSLPDAAISITTADEKVLIECMNSSFDLNTLNPIDFPRFPEVNVDTTVILPAKKISSMVKQVSKAVSKDESRAVLTGIFFTVSNDKVRLVATDSYRLAVSDAVLETPLGVEVEAVIPGKTFDEVSKLISSEKEISIGISENQILFGFGNTVFITRKIEGNFPNYKQLIPKDKDTTATIATSDFVAAVKRASLLAQSHTPIKLSFFPDDQIVTLSSKAQDIGGASEDVIAKIDGEAVEIAFNHQYILDGLSAIESDEILIEIQTSLKPGIFKSVGEDEFLYLAMPVRLG